MKKIFFSMMAVAALLTACNPAEDSYSNNAKNVADSELASRVTFVQSDENGNPQADGNYFTFTTNPATIVTIYTLRPDESENILSQGSASGSFKYAPSRGSDTQQTIYVRAMNADGSTVEATKTVTVFVPGELEMPVRYLASNDYGTKTWKWDPSITGAVWGNMGYQPGTGASVGIEGNGQWWGVTTSEEFNGQLQHTEDNTNHGDGDLDAYMVFSEDGLLTAYDAEGNAIRSSVFSVENWDPAGEWKVGDLKTTAILWPYEINSGGNIPGTYEICYLTPDKMTLVYPDGGSQGGWGEASFWHFCSNTDQSGMLAGYDSGKSWTWDTSITGAVWGNMGYQPGDGASVGTAGNGQWWGVTTSEEFNGQLQHTEDETNHGDGDLDAYMTFGTDGLLNAYDASGKAIRTDTYEIVPVQGNTWKVADLKTKAILWPYEINSGGNIPGTYEVVYLTGDKMTLVYPDGGSQGGWGEASFWHFKAK